MQAQLDARIAPWLPQPVIDAKADLQNVDLAPRPGRNHAVSGKVEAGPDAGAGVPATLGQARADTKHRARPLGHRPAAARKGRGRACFHGTTWTMPQPTVRPGGGRIEAEGAEPRPAPAEARARTRRGPATLYTESPAPP